MNVHGWITASVMIGTDLPFWANDGATALGAGWEMTGRWTGSAALAGAKAVAGAARDPMPLRPMAGPARLSSVGRMPWREKSSKRLPEDCCGASGLESRNESYGCWCVVLRRLQTYTRNFDG